jgi:hypothetical protein
MSLFGKNQPQQPTTPAATTDDTFHHSDAGKRRIAELRGGDGRGRLFTSDLSVHEFVMVERRGPRDGHLRLPHRASGLPPVDGARQPGQLRDGQLFTQALYDAREIAMERMQAEARELTATGVVGVRVTEEPRG